MKSNKIAVVVETGVVQMAPMLLARKNTDYILGVVGMKKGL